MTSDLNIIVDAEGVGIAGSRLPTPPVISDVVALLGTAYRVEESRLESQGKESVTREYVWDALGLRATSDLDERVMTLAIVLRRIDSHFCPLTVYCGSLTLAGSRRDPGEPSERFMGRVVSESPYKNWNTSTQINDEHYSTLRFGRDDSPTHKITINQLASELAPYVSFYHRQANAEPLEPESADTSKDRGEITRPSTLATQRPKRPVRTVGNVVRDRIIERIVDWFIDSPGRILLVVVVIAFVVYRLTR